MESIFLVVICVYHVRLGNKSPTVTFLALFFFLKSHASSLTVEISSFRSFQWQTTMAPRMDLWQLVRQRLRLSPKATTQAPMIHGALTRATKDVGKGVGVGEGAAGRMMDVVRNVRIQIKGAPLIRMLLFVS